MSDQWLLRSVHHTLNMGSVTSPVSLRRDAGGGAREPGMMGIHDNVIVCVRGGRVCHDVCHGVCVCVCVCVCVVFLKTKTSSCSR